MQTNDATEQQNGLDSAALLVDGEPLLFDLVGWTPESIGASEPVLRTTGAMPLEFELWGEQKAARKDLNEFLHRVLVQ